MRINEKNIQRVINYKQNETASDKMTMEAGRNKFYHLVNSACVLFAIMFIFGILSGWKIKDEPTGISREILVVVDILYTSVAIYSALYIQIGLNGFPIDIPALVILTYSVPMGIYLCNIKPEAGLFLLTYSVFIISRIAMYFFMP